MLGLCLITPTTRDVSYGHLVRSLQQNTCCNKTLQYNITVQPGMFHTVIWYVHYSKIRVAVKHYRKTLQYNLRVQYSPAGPAQ